MARKQVERLRPSARLQAVARPVETYVRPAEQPAPRSGLGEFIRAIAPAAETLAQVEKQKQLKLQREAEQGIASERTFAAKLSVGAALRQAREDYRNNEPDYLEMSEEEITTRRAEIMQPFLQQAQDSGDDLLFQAVKGNIEMGNLAWFETTYDPAKFKHNFNINMGKVGDEVIGITSDIGYGTAGFEDEDGDPALAANRQFSRDLQKKNIDEIVRQASQAYGYSQSMVNDYVMDNVVFPRVKENGRDAAYEWAKERDLFNVSRYQKQVKVMESELDQRDRAALKAQDPIWLTTNLGANVRLFKEASDDKNKIASPSILAVGTEVTLPSGAKHTVTVKDAQKAAEQVAAEEGWTTDQRMAFFRSAGFVGLTEENNIKTGLWLFSSSADMERPDNQAAAQLAYDTISSLKAAGVPIPTSLMSEDQYKRFKVAKFLKERKAIPFKDAVGLSQTADITLTSISATDKKELESKLSTIFFTGHNDTVNRERNLRQFEEDVILLRQADPYGSLEDIMEQAAQIFEEDHIITTSSNGVKFSVRQENTDPNVSLPVVETLNSLAAELAKSKNGKLLLSTVYSNVDNAGIVILDDAGNPNQFRVMVIDERGGFQGSLGMLTKQEVLNDPTALYNLMAQNVEEAKAEGVLREKEVAAQRAIDDEQWESPDDMMLDSQPVTKETIVEAATSTVAPIASVLEAAGEAARPFLQSVKETLTSVFAQEKFNAPDLVSETVSTVAPQVVQAKGDITPFFEEEFKTTKRKLTNIGAIKEAQKRLSGNEAAIKDLGLDVRGYLSSGGVSRRGITQKQQATIARSIIAVQNASIRQHNVETSEDLTTALTKASNIKGVRAEDILENVIKPIAFHESDGTMDPTIKQYGDGPARGVMQYEPPRFQSSLVRAKAFFTQQGEEVPQWIQDIPVRAISKDGNKVIRDDEYKATQDDIVKLSANQQMALAVYDLLMKGSSKGQVAADLGKVASGEIDLTTFWLDHWAIPAESDRYKRSKSFKDDLKANK